MRTGLAVAVLLIVGLLRAAPANAATTYLYVGGSGCSDAGSGSAGVPFCTISAAAKVATADQTVVVAAGTYDENVTPKNSGKPGAPIEFTAADGAVVTVAGQSHGFTVASRHDITIRGFTVSSTSSTGIYLKNSTRIVVDRNTVTSAGQRVAGLTAAGIYVAGTNDSTISNNVSFDNSDAGIYLTGGSTGIDVISNETYGNARGYTRAAPGIDVRSPGNEIIGNISHDNEDSGIQFYPGGDNNLVANNVIYRNKGWSPTLGVIGDHGIDDLGVRGNRIIANSVYDSVTAGINVEGLAASWLTGPIGTTDTTLTVGTATGFPTTGSFTIQIDDEQIGVTAGQGTTTWTVKRAVNATTPAAHQAGSSTNKNVLQWSGFVIENNVLVDNAVNCPDGSGGLTTCPHTKGNIRIDQTSFVGVTADYDLMYLSVPGTLGTWRNTLYSSLDAFRTASGQEPHGLTGDPHWVDARAGDLHLVRGSPAVDAADSGVSGEQSTDRDGNSRQDDLRTPNTGAGPRTYDDRGAYEYQPDYPPTAALTISPSSGAAPVQVTADASGSTDDAGIASYTFDFGDGSPPVGPQAASTASHTYEFAGTFTVGTTVTDTAGQSVSATQPVTIMPAPGAPTAALSLSPDHGVAPLAVTADASASADLDGDAILSYTFDFGDGSPPVGPQSAATSSHTYAPGTWIAAVTVTDSQGLAARTTKTITIDAPPANLIGNAGFESGTTGWNTSGRAAIALTTVSGGHSGSDAAELTNTSTSTQPDCTLNDAPNWVSSAQAGTYLASAWVRGPAGSTLAMRLREYNGSTFVGSAMSTTTLTSDWTQFALSYPLGVVGSTLDLTVYTTNSAPGWCFDADDLWLSVSSQPDDPPTAALTVTPTSGAAPLQISADASASTDGDATPIGSYTFDFGDGSPSTGPQPQAAASHSYTVGGTFAVTVTATDTIGQSSSATTTVTVDGPSANLIGNAGFESGTTGWNTSGRAAIALTTVSGGHSGSDAAELTNTSTSTQPDCTLNDAPNWVSSAQAGTYLASAWVRGPAGSTLAMRLREYNGSTFVGSAMSTTTLTSDWTQFALSYPLGVVGSTLDLTVYTTNSAPGWCFDADDLSLTVSNS
jgi:parallel beta-helix repeat protein